MIDKQLLQKRFSNSATTYDQYANVQKEMAQQLMEWIEQKQREQNQIEQKQRVHEHDLDEGAEGNYAILEIGCGTGYLTQMVHSLFPQAQIVAVDIAQGMIQVAQERCAHPQISYLCGDIEEMELTQSFDLIISNATVQWFNQPQRTIKRLFSLLKPQGSFCFSTFGSETFHELHHSYQKALESLNYPIDDYRPGQSFLSDSELQDLLAEQDFSMTGKEQIKKEYFDSVKDFLHSVKKIGANNNNAGALCQRPSILKKMLQQYEQNYKVENKVPATYHCLYYKIERI